mgnify:FL=1
MNLKKSKQLKNQLLEQLKRTPIVEAACHKAGISRQTFYRWKAEDAEFAKEIDKAVTDGQMLVNDLAESQLISALKDRNFQAITYWLKHHHPNYKTKIQIEGSLQMPQEELTPEQEELVKEALRLASLSSAADTEQGEENDGAVSIINNNNQVKNHEQNTTKAKE